MGDGPRHIALIHGFAGSGTVWHDLISRALNTGRYRVTTVDLRGHGQSPRANSYALRDYADNLIESLPTGLHALWLQKN